jgi:hypothetical protein
MSNEVDKELLDKIYHQYTRLSSVPLPQFNAANFTADVMLDKYKEFLKTLPMEYLNGIGCKPKCNDNSCPPCDEWGLSDYQDFLRQLETKSG